MPAIAPVRTGERPAKTLEAVAGLNKELALTNVVYLSPFDLAALCGPSEGAEVKYVQINGMILVAGASEAVPAGKVAFNAAQRNSVKVSIGEAVGVVGALLPDELIQAASLSLSVDLVGRASPSEAVSSETLTAKVKDTLRGHVLSLGQSVVCEVQGANLMLKVVAVAVFKESVEGGLDGGAVSGLWAGGGVEPRALMGLVGANTQVKVSLAPGSALKLTAEAGSQAGTSDGAAGNMKGSALFRPDFALEDLGIGGLDQEVGSIFRRAFASRVYPPALLQRMGLNHVRGVLLYGPPGCGKTLIARKIGKLLTDREPKVVNGPEVLSKYVGQSEANVRDLFAEAREEYDEKGDESGLHVIILDELDAISKQRGKTSGDAGTGDSVVNQLLSYIDGVHGLNNVLIIGMTNRKDLLDEALLRPGRLEVHVEIGLPDEAGRVQIARIHLAGMKRGGHLDPAVTPERIAQHTENYAGAEIEGICRAAASFAFDRNIKVAGGHLSPDDAASVNIAWEDFQLAMAEVRPAHGVDEQGLATCFRRGLFAVGPRFKQLQATLASFVDQVRGGEGDSSSKMTSLLLTGPAGTGKTALAAYAAAVSKVPFVRLISAEALVGQGEEGKMHAILSAFDGAYRSKEAIIILDGVERLLGWSRIGPRFSNDLLQILSVLVGKEPPAGRRLLLIATSSNEDALSELELTERFDAVLHVPLLSTSEVAALLSEVRLFAEKDVGIAAATLAALTKGSQPDGDEGFSIKKLLTLLDHARTEAARSNGESAGEGGEGGALDQARPRSVVSIPALISSLSDFGYAES